MNKTYTINLGGRAYTIDEDAYKLLDDYLKNLRFCMKNEDGASEIIDDIETRMSELFQEPSVPQSEIITMKQVEKVIAIIGKPEELSQNETAEDEAKKSNSKKTNTNSSKTQSKHFYRDVDNKIFGGVASGLGAYMNWDTTAIRLILAILLLFGYGTPIIIYLAAWIIVSPAKTAGEKLRMRGEKVTVENIGKTVSNSHKDANNSKNTNSNPAKPQTGAQAIGGGFVTAIGFILKVLLAIIALIAVPFIILLGVILIILVFAIIVTIIGGGSILTAFLPFSHHFINNTCISINYIPIFCWILVLGIPLGALVRTILRNIFHWTPMSTYVKLILLVIWIISLMMAIFTDSGLINSLNMYLF